MKKLLGAVTALVTLSATGCFGIGRIGRRHAHRGDDSRCAGDRPPTPSEALTSWASLRRVHPS